MKSKRNHLLWNARSQRNLTINQLAEAAKIGASTVWRAEHKYAISAESRQRLCTYFGLPSQELGLVEVENTLSQTIPIQQPEHIFSNLANDTYISASTGEPPFLITTSTLPDPLLSQQSEAPLEEQLSTWLALGSSNLASLFDAGWTLEAILNSLRIVLLGVQGMPSSARNILLQMNSSALRHTITQPTSDHISQEARYRLLRALEKSIDEGWHLFHKAPPAQVRVVAQTLLYLVQQLHSILPSDVRPSLYAAIYNLLGASLLFQGHYTSARRAHEKAQIAALEGADIWSMAQSLNWQAIVSQYSGNFQEALQTIEAALRLLGQHDNEACLRLRAHLLADWAYNAAHLPEFTHLQEQLNVSATLIKPLPLDEEFDYLQWYQVTGSCFMLRGNYSEAIRLLEQSMVQLPSSWLVRHLLALFPLAETYARAGERDASLETGSRIAELLDKVNAKMFKIRFNEYYQVLSTIFPHDQRVRTFIAQTRQQTLSPYPISTEHTR